MRMPPNGNIVLIGRRDFKKSSIFAKYFIIESLKRAE
jgi:hypothetical protein